jgi:hypothetical protein
MTKSIIELIEESKVPSGIRADLILQHPNVQWVQKLLALHRASIIEELAGQMPEPVGAAYRLSDVSHCTITKARNYIDLYTATQMREYAAGLALKAVAAERKACADLCEHLSARACDAGDCADSIMERGNI